MMTIDDMQQMLDEIAGAFPKEFFSDLNGGISLLPQAKRSPHAAADDLYILGEYHHDSMGRYVYIYYGSFLKIYGHLAPQKLRERLKKTVSHEFTHHLESLAGERGLEIKDQEQLAGYKARSSEQ